MYLYIFRENETKKEMRTTAVSLNAAYINLGKTGDEIKPWECWQGPECVWHMHENGDLQNGPRPK